MQLPKKLMQEIVWGDSEEGVEVEDYIHTHSRWGVWHTFIFKYKDKFYSVDYEVGATEYQERRPFEDDGELIEVIEVEPIEVVKIIYLPKKVKGNGNEG